MASGSVESRALSLVKAFERDGKTVSRVTIEGRKIELVLSEAPAADDFARIDMRYDKA
jgi:hypothetical protein